MLVLSLVLKMLKVTFLVEEQVMEITHKVSHRLISSALQTNKRQLKAKLLFPKEMKAIHSMFKGLIPIKFFKIVITMIIISKAIKITFIGIQILLISLKISHTIKTNLANKTFIMTIIQLFNKIQEEDHSQLIYKIHLIRAVMTFFPNSN